MTNRDTHSYFKQKPLKILFWRVSILLFLFLASFSSNFSLAQADLKDTTVNKTKIYISEGTLVKNLSENINPQVEIVYAKPKLKESQKLASNSEKKTSTTPKQTKTSSDKKTKLTISPSPASKNSIALLQSYTAAAIVTSNISFTKKLLDTIISCNHYFRDFEVNTKEVSNFLFQETKISFWLYSHTTRPPPLVLDKLQSKII